jgi:hypothetical protein
VSEFEIAKLVLAVGFELAKIIIDAFTSGDHSQLHRPLSDFIPAELKTSLARRKAELEAKAKFGA